MPAQFIRLQTMVVSALTPLLLCGAGNTLADGFASSSVPRSSHTTEKDPQRAETDSIDLVVLVDESASLSEMDVARERQSVGAVAQSPLNPRSRVSVVGFGSDDGGPGQNPVTLHCPPTVVKDDVARQFLAQCVGGIHRRSPAEGSGTDHAAALAQALSILNNGSPKGSSKAVLLLTDGKLDVSDSPHYGNPRDRNPAAKAEIQDLLTRANQNGVQIWSLGFGREIDMAELREFTARGSRGKSCPVPPRAETVSGSEQVLEYIVDLFAGATCSHVEPGPMEKLPSGSSKTLHVRISPLATDGTIIVVKGDPRTRVTFRRPDGVVVPASGPAGADYLRSGENTATEVLQITDPVPGTWSIVLSSPSGIDTHTVRSLAVWQGALRAALVADPPAPEPGQEVVVRLALLTRKGKVTDSQSLQGLDVTVKASIGGSSSVTVRDDGRQPDEKAHDGTWSGTVRAPASGGFTISGVVTGPGVRARTVSLDMSVSAVGTVPRIHLQVPAPTQLWAGRIVSGELSADVPGDRPLPIRLVTADTGSDLRIALSPRSTFRLPAGSSSRKVSFTVLAGSGLGPTTLTLRAVDADGTVLGNSLVSFTVREPPGFVERHETLLALLAVLAALALLACAVCFRIYRRRRDVRGIELVLHLEDDSFGSEPETLRPRRQWSSELCFEIRPPQSPGSRLAKAGRQSSQAHRLRRAGKGRVRIESPSGHGTDLMLDGDCVSLPGDPDLRVSARKVRVRGLGPRRDRRAVSTEPARGTGLDDMTGAHEDDGWGPSFSAREEDDLL
jgi:Mg-chelatase subunit ChlD